MVVNPPSADGSLQPAVDQCDINSVPRAETQVEVDQADTNSRSESPGAEMQEEVDQGETMNTSSVSESPRAEMQEEIQQGGITDTSSESEPPRAEMQEEIQQGGITDTSSESEPPRAVEFDQLADTNHETNTLEQNPDLNVPLYPGAKITLHLALLLILAFTLSHKISNEAIEDLLSLLHAMLFPPSVLPTSLYKFFKLLNIKREDTIRCYYCPSCQHPVDDPNAANCLNSTCSKAFSTPSDLGYFVLLPLEKHIQNVYSRPGFLDRIKHRFMRKKQKQNAIEDIYDGSLYKEHMKNGGVLANPVNISLLWNTDGVPVFKSSNFSIWPLYFVINELPYRLRMKMKNVILAGLWFGSVKPNMQLFLRPFWKVLRKMETEGLQVKAWNASKSFVARVILLAGTCDLPAKCLVQNFKQFNGFYGCGKCLQPGSTYTLGQSSRKHVYLYEPANPTGPLRTKEQTSDDVKWFKENGTSKNGVLGPSWFHCLRHLDMIKGTGLDYMHGCLLGVTRQMLSLWLNTEHKNDKFYIGNHIAVLNRRLLSIQPPNEISRCPRSFTDRKHWKASEYRSFLFYYSLPVLFGVLPLEYFHHFALFAIAVRLFASESISPSELTKGTLYLDLFCKKFGEYYSEQYIGINLHSLLHLSSTVEELGPLWAYSCFAFEGFNGILLKNVHGTQGIALQCMRTYNMTQAFPFKEQIPLGEELEQLKFVKETTGTISLFQHSNHIRPSGKAVVSALSSEEKRLLDNFLPESLMSYKQYQRIRIGMEVYSTQESSTLRKRCNSCVFFKNSSYSFGQVQNFVEVVTNSQQCLLALIKPYDCVGAFNDFAICKNIIFSVKEKEECIVIKAVDFCGKCVSVVLSEVLYISKLVNIEKD